MCLRFYQGLFIRTSDDSKWSISTWYSEVYIVYKWSNIDQLTKFYFDFQSPGNNALVEDHSFHLSRASRSSSYKNKFISKLSSDKLSKAGLRSFSYFEDGFQNILINTFA